MKLFEHTINVIREMINFPEGYNSRVCENRIIDSWLGEIEIIRNRMGQTVDSDIINSVYLDSDGLHYSEFIRDFGQHWASVDIPFDVITADNPLLHVEREYFQKLITAAKFQVRECRAATKAAEEKLHNLQLQLDAL